MNTYRIHNVASGTDLGPYQGESERHAVAAMYRDAGYSAHVTDDGELVTDAPDFNISLLRVDLVKKIEITLSDASPVKIDPEVWPVIASADDHDGAVKVQANTEWLVRVRQHADGRRIVYGYKRAGNGGQYRGFRDAHPGYLLDAGADESETIRAIRRVAGAIGRDDLGADCIGDLPAREI